MWMWEKLKALPGLSLSKGASFALIATAAVVIVFWWTAWGENLIQELTAQDGQIIVNSPTVYTRQRLVNDRLSQTAWLQDQLLVTKGSDRDFRSIDQVSVHRETRGANLTLAVGGNGAQPGNLTLNVAPPSKPGTPSPSSSSSTEAPVQEPESNERPAASLVVPTTSDLFRAKNTYREEVRAEMMETQLDDRHDIQGNTIYRLAFDATVLAGTRTDALAVIKVKLSHDWKDKQFAADYSQLYEEWLRYMQKVVDDSATQIAQTLYFRTPLDVRLRLTLPKFLLRAICYFVAQRTGPGLPLEKHQCNAQQDSEEMKMAQTILREYTAAYLEQRKNIIDAMARSNILNASGTTDVKQLKDNKAILSELQRRCQENTGKQNKSPDALTAELLLSTTPVTIKCPRYDDEAIEGLLGGAMLVELISKRQQRQVSIDELPDLLKALKQDCGEPKASCALPQLTLAELQCFAASYMTANLNSFYDRGNVGEHISYLMNIKPIGRETNNCRLLLAPKSKAANLRPQDGAPRDDADKPATCEGVDLTISAERLKCRLNDSTEVYAYSITPKNLVQRVSSASDTTSAIQALLGARLDVQGRDLESLVQTLRRKFDERRAIESNPIVVGFGFASASTPRKRPKQWTNIVARIWNGSGEQTKATSTEKSTEFGWVIAPQVRVDGGRAQVDGQYALAAVISVPSWWHSVQLKIERCWFSRRTLHTTENFEQCSNGMPEIEDVVRLPGAIPEVSEKLGFEVVQEPHLTSRGPAAPIQVGQPAELILTGVRLWRSTEVTLGAQKADEIVVLPNMEGIIAKFKCIRPQMPLSALEDLPVEIRVWTSEGVTDSVLATLSIPGNLKTVMQDAIEIDARGEMRRLTVCPDENSPHTRLGAALKKPTVVNKAH